MTLPTPAAHARLAPSSAARWVQCPGSVRMCEAFPDDLSDPEASEEGTLAHELAAAMVNGEVVTCDDDEMFESAETYRDAVHGVLATWSEPFEMHVEEQVYAPQIHSDNWGTPDTWMFNRARLRLDVFDFKYGHGIVEVFENWQLLNYASAVVHSLQLGTAEVLLSVNLHIVQPRAYHRDGQVRSWSLSGEALRGYTNRLGRAASAAVMTSDPQCITGPECRYCAARFGCPARIAAGYLAMDMAGASLPLDMTPEVMGLILRQVKDGIAGLSAMETGLEQQLLATIRNGVRVPGWHAEAGSGREKWRVSYDEVVMLGSLMGINVAKPGLITPKQAVAAGLPRELVSAYTETPSGAVKLVRDDGRLAGVFGRSVSASLPETYDAAGYAKLFQNGGA